MFTVTRGRLERSSPRLWNPWLLATMSVLALPTIGKHGELVRVMRRSAQSRRLSFAEIVSRSLVTSSTDTSVADAVLVLETSTCHGHLVRALRIAERRVRLVDVVDVEERLDEGVVAIRIGDSVVVQVDVGCVRVGFLHREEAHMGLVRPPPAGHSRSRIEKERVVSKRARGVRVALDDVRDEISLHPTFSPKDIHRVAQSSRLAPYSSLTPRKSSSERKFGMMTTPSRSSVSYAPRVASVTRERRACQSAQSLKARASCSPIAFTIVPPMTI